MKLIDQFDRTISYLRVSVTDRCNLRCSYCKPAGDLESLDHEDILTFEELFRLIEIGSTLGIEKVRITGGEPLVRSGLVDFIPQLTAISGLEDVSLTTNGIYLKNHLEELYAGGIQRLNISLDTLRRDRYRQITGADRFDTVWAVLERARQMNFHPIKINMVVIKGFNEDEVVEMAALSRIYPYHIRFIEYMPLGDCSQEASFKTVPMSRIKEQVGKLGNLIPVLKSRNGGPAERFKLGDAPGEIGFISSMSHHFCGNCNRLRLTANGKLRSCLLSNFQEDIIGPMRRGATDQELAEIFFKAVQRKPREHLLVNQTEQTLSGQMYAIGG
jgi:cyclic pyranopterin phosphate synthase